MKKTFIFFSLLLLAQSRTLGQAGVGPAPYCMATYWNIPCNQPNNSNNNSNYVNDFIDDFNTSGAVTNITTNNTGCQTQLINGNSENYFFYGCNTHLRVNAGQVITCNFLSGIIFGQGFAVYIDYNKDCAYSMGEMVCGTPNVPPAATPASATFQVPGSILGGAYKLRVRCAYATVGTSIDPCMQYSFGEVHEYRMFVGSACTATLPVCTPLPIELKSFNAFGYGNYADIEWTTASELNSDYFTLERSFDYENFELVQKIDGAGNYHGDKLYHVSDMKAKRNGLTYYRLSEIDKDGILKFTQTISLKMDQVNSEIQMMPVPVDDQMQVIMPDGLEGENVEIEISDISGKVQMHQVKEIKFSEQVKMDVSGLQKGLYIMKVISGQQVVQSKFVKN